MRQLAAPIAMIHCNIKENWEDVQLLIANGLQPLVANYFRNQVYEVVEYHWTQSTLHLICNAIRVLAVPEFTFVIECYKDQLHAELKVCSTFRDLGAHTLLINAYAAIIAGRNDKVHPTTTADSPTSCACRSSGHSSTTRTQICCYY